MTRQKNDSKKNRVMEEHICEDIHFTIEQLDKFDIVSNITCNDCKRDFSNKSAFNTHMHKIHGKSHFSYK